MLNLGLIFFCKLVLSISQNQTRFQIKGLNKTFNDYIEQTKYYSKYASATYCPDSSLLNWNCLQKCINPVSSVRVFNNAATQTKGYIGIDHQYRKIILSFRGSVNLENFNLDFNSIPIKIGKNPQFENDKMDNDMVSSITEAYVHRGFLEAANSLYPEYKQYLEEILNTIEYKDYNLVITGHSLGASIASISSVLIRTYLNIPWDKMELFTYGEPRTGLSSFASLINQSKMTCIRAVNKNDLITNLPSQLNGFIHHNRELWVKNRNSDIICSEGSLEDPNCSVSVLVRSINDHLHIWDTNFDAKC